MEVGWWMLRDGAIGTAVVVGLFIIIRIIFYRTTKNREAVGKNPARIRAIFTLMIIFWLLFTFVIMAFGGFGLYAVGFGLTVLLLIFLIILTPDKFLYYPIAIAAVTDLGQSLVAVFAGNFDLLDLVISVVRFILLLTAMLLNYKALKKGSIREWGQRKLYILRGISIVLAVGALAIGIVSMVIGD